MYDKTHWSIGLTALGLLLTAMAIVYSGIIKQPADFSVSESGISANLLPLGEELDFAPLKLKLSVGSDLSYPKLSPSTEVGVDISGLFSLTGDGAVE